MKFLQNPVFRTKMYDLIKYEYIKLKNTFEVMLIALLICITFKFFNIIHSHSLMKT